VQFSAGADEALEALAAELSSILSRGGLL